MKTKHWIVFITLGMIWSSSFLWIKIGVQEIGPMSLVAFRMLFGALTAIGIAVYQRLSLPRDLKTWGIFAVLGPVSLAIPVFLISWGEQTIDSAVASILNATVPLFTLLIAHFWIQDDKITFQKTLGLLSGFGGVMILMSKDLLASEHVSVIGQFAVILASLFYAGSAVAIRKYTQHINNTMRGVGLLMTSAVLMWIVGPLAERPFEIPALPITWVAALWLGVLGSGLAMIMMYYLIHEIGPTRASLVTYLFPVGGVLLGVIFLDEHLSWQLIAGTVLIIASLAVVNYTQRGHKLRFFRSGKAQFVTAGIIQKENRMKHRSGFIAIIGRPNVGKSTLLNALLGQKIAAVSPRPQTTRRRQLGILTLENAQLIFVDTPGLHTAKHKLGEFLNQEAQEALNGVDLILWLVDASTPPTEEDANISSMLKSVSPRTRRMLVLNKMDMLKPEDESARESGYVQLIEKATVMKISAAKRLGIGELLEALIQASPQREADYPEEQITDLYEREIAGDLIREACLIQLRDEVPHGMAVRIDEFKERENGMAYIAATIFVERESQKGIVIGEGGKMLKSIGSAARKEIEAMGGRKVFLELRVKVSKDWRNDPNALKLLGYGRKKQ